MSQAARSQDGHSLAGVRVAVFGKLSSMPRREAERVIREHGGTVLDRPDLTTNLLVLSDEQPVNVARRAALRRLPLAGTISSAIERGEIEVIHETDLWRRLGLVDTEHDIQRLYTPAMLAELVKAPLTHIRRWYRRGFLRASRTVGRLPYFDFRQVLVARQLAVLWASDVSPGKLEHQWRQWEKSFSDNEVAPNFEIVFGRHLLRRQADDLVEGNGQRWFSFVSQNTSNQVGGTADDVGELVAAILPLATPFSPDDSAAPKALVKMAEDLEDRRELAAAADMYRTALAAGGPDADANFALAELLYRLGDVSAARERYFMAIELDEEFVEARVNLGCLLEELGETQLAMAAFEGALRFHPDYADAHYHLAKTLQESDRSQEARSHWQAFLRLAPNSPWAAEVRLMLELAYGNEHDEV
jgi:tetratricopeptide (TPR) repeat protein